VLWRIKEWGLHTHLISPVNVKSDYINTFKFQAETIILSDLSNRCFSASNDRPRLIVSSLVNIPFKYVSLVRDDGFLNVCKERL